MILAHDAGGEVDEGLREQYVVHEDADSSDPGARTTPLSSSAPRTVSSSPRHKSQPARPARSCADSAHGSVSSSFLAGGRAGCPSWSATTRSAMSRRSAARRPCSAVFRSGARLRRTSTSASRYSARSTGNGAIVSAFAHVGAAVLWQVETDERHALVAGSTGLLRRVQIA